MFCYKPIYPVFCAPYFVCGYFKEILSQAGPYCSELNMLLIIWNIWVSSCCFAEDSSLKRRVLMSLWKQHAALSNNPRRLQCLSLFFSILPVLPAKLPVTWIISLTVTILFCVTWTLVDVGGGVFCKYLSSFSTPAVCRTSNSTFLSGIKYVFNILTNMEK